MHSGRIFFSYLWKHALLRSLPWHSLSIEKIMFIMVALMPSEMFRPLAAKRILKCSNLSIEKVVYQGIVQIPEGR